MTVCGADRSSISGVVAPVEGAQCKVNTVESIFVAI